MQNAQNIQVVHVADAPSFTALCARGIAQECNEFVTAVMQDLVEPTGMRKGVVLDAPNHRGWNKRQTAFQEAHCEWVDVDSRDADLYMAVCVTRAKAAHALYSFALGMFTIPRHIIVPAAVLRG